MDYSTGKLTLIFLIAVGLTWLGAWWLARRYRAAMRRLMSAPLTAAPATAVGTDVRGRSTASPPSPPQPIRAVTAEDNRRAGVRLAGLQVGLSVLMALSQAALQLHVVATDLPFSLRRLATLGFAYLWPVLPALALLWRWSRWRLIGAIALWFVLSYPVLLLQMIEPDPRQALVFLGSAIGPALLAVTAVCMGSATRAVAPWLLPPLIGLVWASMAGLDLIARLADDPPAWLHTLTGLLGAYGTVALFAFAPWLIAWWPLKRVGRWMAEAYAGHGCPSCWCCSRRYGRSCWESRRCRRPARWALAGW